MTSMIKSSGDLMAFFERPIAAILGIVTLALWLLSLLMRLWKQRTSIRRAFNS